MGRGAPGRRLDLLPRRLGPAVGDVLEDAGREQQRVLQHDRELTPQIYQLEVPDVLAIQLDAALPWLREQLEAVQELHPDRMVVVGETGWATQVHDEGEQAELIKGVPGENEQKIFHEAVRAWAVHARQPVFFFEAFDENWKGGPHPSEVEKHWGLFRADRSAKAALAEDES